MLDPSSINVVLNVLGLIGISATLGVFLRYRLAIKKLASGDMADIRDHYAQEVTALRAKLNAQEEHFRALEKHWREMLEASDKRHDECERLREQARQELWNLQREIEGLRVQILRYSADAVFVIEPEPSNFVKDAAERVRKIVDERDGK